MEDAHARVLEYLEAQPELSGWKLVAAASYPPSNYKPADGPCAAFKVRGGDLSEEAELQFPSVQFKIYGTSPLDAVANYKTLHDVLQHAQGAYVRWARAETIGQPLLDEAGWPYVLAFYGVTLRNEA